MITRRNHRFLSSADKTKFIDAVLALKKTLTAFCIQEFRIGMMILLRYIKTQWLVVPPCLCQCHIDLLSFILGIESC
jgi:hypothetical protein